MKLIVAIVQDYDCDAMLRAIAGCGFRATRIASTGGFLRTGNTTVIMGVEDDEVAPCVRLIRSACQSRVQRVPEALASGYTEWNPAGIAEMTIGGAVIFVTKVGRFERIGEVGR